jgi:protein-S-isoprenylcysteine O-methyltransferase Ste14
MTFVTISRILLALLIINEIFVVVRTPPEERERIILPPLFPLPVLLIFAPFFFVLDLPVWLALPAVLIQAAGLFIEVISEFQLMRAQSFGVNADKGVEGQKTGFYRWFEHPIYVGLILQLIGLSFFNPLVLISLALNFVTLRQMVKNERQYLRTTLNFTHQGIDTPLWN